MNILQIDTTDNKNVFAKLTTAKGEFVSNSDNKTLRPDSIVYLIEKVLEKGEIKVEDVNEVKVNEGPGSYTGIKVGVSVGNALSFALDKKINGKKIGQLVEARYE